jgi:transcriptional regulator with XRE-family HTH domain
MSESIGNRIKRLREEKEWSQRELADRIGINYSVLNRIELDKRPVKDHEIGKIADVFSVSTDYLVGKTDKPDGKANQNELNQHDDTYDSLAEINKLVKQYGIEDMGFFDIEKWKNLSPYDVQLIEEHFKMIVKLAKKRNEEKK